MPKHPLSTYRIQFRPEFGFAEAAAVADYLAALGVTHLYASPYLQSAQGSAHGYDVVDPTRVNEELGGEEGHRALCARLGEVGLGQVLDVVPNHMAITEKGNAWWWDVLENGPASRYAGYFDVDWNPPQARLRDTVLLPILGDHYGRVLEAGELQLVRKGGKFEIHYFDHRMPVAPRSLDGLLAEAAGRCEAPEDADALAFLADALAALPESTATDRASVDRRHRDKEVIAAQLDRLCRESPAAAAAVDAVVAEVNADFDRLDALLKNQNYRPAFWRTAGRELDYRRFFDVHTLVGLRMEEERVFDDTHGLVLRWLREGVIDGLRIDHPDGLRDPKEYLERLRRATSGAWVVVEKILEPGEPLPEDWPVAGTTGYDFLNRAGGLFVDPSGKQPLTDLYRELTGERTDWPAMVREKKLMVLTELLASDVNRLGELFLQVCERHRRHRDYTRFELREALAEVAACFPVYRTYVRAEEGEVGDEDRRHVAEAIAKAKEHRPDLDPGLFDFFADVLLLGVRGGPESELVMRFQQLTGPAMAKGVEDTAFYNYHRLVALNEVGGSPGDFGVSIERFHAECAEAQRLWPRALLATSTHDTKRSEDVRLRIGLLSEIPDEWERAVRRWFERNARHRGASGPDRNAEYLLYQTLVGAWPLTPERLTAYLEKAVREAKAHTSWTRQDEAYERDVRAFAEALLADEAFVAELEAFVEPLVEPARRCSLAQTLLKLAAPGVPDFYQGTELWDLSLVDPDNRRPVDYELRRRLLAELDEGMAPEEILARMDDGLPKLWVVRQGLRLRKARPRVFGPEGGYEPLRTTGARAWHALGFARGGEVAVVVPRLLLRLGGDWQDTAVELPEGRWRDELTGEETAGGSRPLAELLARFPVALLARP